jgi:hypothetical protein
LLLTQFGIGNPGNLHDMALQAWLKRFLAMYRNRDFFDVAGFAVDAVTTVHSQEEPILVFEQPAHSFAGDCFHISVS